MSKGSNRRPGTGYADNWDRIFGKKAKSEQALQELTDLSQEMRLYDLRDAAIAEAIQKYGTYPGKVWYKQADGSLLPADGGKPNLMTLSEARKAGYALGHANCGPSPSGAVIRVGKWDGDCLQFIDVKPYPETLPRQRLPTPSVRLVHILRYGNVHSAFAPPSIQGWDSAFAWRASPDRHPLPLDSHRHADQTKRYPVRPMTRLEWSC